MPLSRPTLLHDSRRYQWLLCGLLTSAGLLLSVLLGYRLWLGDQAQRALQFEHLAQERLARLEERLLIHQRDLDSLRRFFESSGEVTREEFERFARPLLGENLTLVWAPLLKVDPDQREQQLEAFSRDAIRQAGAHFLLRESDDSGRLRPLQPRERYFPMLFGLSRSIYEPPLGLDMASPGPRRDVLESALATGGIARSSVLRFAGSTDDDRSGLLLVAPVFAAPADDADGPVQLRGALFAAASLRQLLGPSRPEAAGHSLAIELYDLTQPDDAPLYQQGEAATADRLQYSRDYHSGLWQYRLVVRPSEELIAEHPISPVWRLALPGAVLSLMLGALLYILLSQRRRALALVERRTAELRQSREALHQSERRWHLASDGIGDGVWDWDLTHERMYFSPMWKRMLGYAEVDIGDHPDEWRDRLHPEDAARTQQALQEHLAGRTPMYRCENRLRRKDGSWQWLLARGRVVERDADGQPLRVIGTHLDISPRKKLELALRQSHARLQGLLEAATKVAVISVDCSGRIESFNVGAEQLLDLEREDMLGEPLDVLLDLQQLAGAAGLDNLPADAASALGVLLGQRQQRELDAQLLRRDHTPLAVSLMLSTLLEADGHLAGYLLIACESGWALRARQAQVGRSLMLDKLDTPLAASSSLADSEAEACAPSADGPLSGVPSRRQCIEQLGDELARRTRSNRPLSLILFDVDQLKHINAELGFGAGQRLIQQLCRRFTARLRRIDGLFWLGGEVFVVICPETSGEQALYLAERLRRLLQETPFAEAGQVTASFGVSSASPGDSPENLLLRADRVLAEAKAGGRNRVCAEGTALPA